MATLRERIRAKGELLLAHAPILTLGCTVVTSLSLATLATTMVLSTASQTSSTENNTSVANTYQLRKPRGKNRRVRSESDWKKYYGSSDELNAERTGVGDNAFFRREILSVHTTKGKVNFEETKQLFLHNVLTEALDDGTPKYYNSNILGRYYRKDYFPWQNTEET